jgi:paired amphipathic helix protein Sin3a
LFFFLTLQGKEYLDKLQNAVQKDIYEQFIKVLKEKRQDIQGLIKRVVYILADYPDLILNFNAFLPLGYKVEVDGTTGDTTLDAKIAAETAEGKIQFITTPAPSLPSSLARTNPATLPHSQCTPATMTPAQMDAIQKQQQQKLLRQQQLRQQLQQFVHLQIQRQQVAQQQLVHQQQHQQSIQQQMLHTVGATSDAAAPKPDFENLDRERALSYVTKVKRRFINEPERYQQFLLILQEYKGQQQAYQELIAGGCERPSEQAQQTHQLSIREVLDRVTELFQDHTDLLSDFTYFLPDAVRVQARDRIRPILNKKM